MRKARSLGHKEGEHLGRVNWDDILSPLISPFCRMGQRNKAGPAPRGWSPKGLRGMFCTLLPLPASLFVSSFLFPLYEPFLFH